LGYSDWLIGVGLAVLLTQRQKRIDEFSEHFLTDLDTFDPVARAQVLKAIAGQELNLKQ
jgi:hypothetical protein